LVKRVLDVGLALLLAPLALIATGVASIAIRLESAGPALFAQPRVGLHGQQFTCYKLRTMYLDTPQAGSHEVARHAVTRVGSMLRRMKVDELPQLWNVLRGDMSFVGPRPSLPTQHELIACRERRGVLDMKPGITGLAQVRGVDMSTPELLADVDAEYGRSASVIADLALMLRTLTGQGSGDRVGA
jgi:lipopolysaccharide/colanic/teichoic acid biosynthesis glycosyltransferase